MYSENIYFSEIIDQKRWDVCYLSNFSLPVRKIKDNPRFRLEKLGNKYLTTIISDGEHIQLPRQRKKGIRYLYGRNIKEGIINFDPISDYSYIDEKIYKEHNRIHLQDGDVLVEIYGTIGKTALYRKQSYIGIAGIPRHIARIHTTERLLPGYLAGILLSKFGKTQMEMSGTGNIQHLLSLKSIKELIIPIPKKIEVQREIAEIIEKTICLETKALGKINQARDMFIKALWTGLTKIKKEDYYKVNFSDLDYLWTPKFYYPLYQNTLKKIRRKFETIKLCEIPVDISKGDEVGSDNYKRYLEKTDTDVPFIRTSDIINYEIDNYPDFYISKDIYNELNQDLRPSDILFTKDGKIGLSAILTDFDKCILASGISRLRIKDILSPYYIFTVLSTKIGLYQALQRTVTAATIPHLRLDRLVEIEIPILKEDKRDEISELIKDAFGLKNERKLLVKQAKKMVERILE
ncbi:MAG: restriction endonuclease subunit S [Candidatus Hodarchaeota archaeon]